MNKFVLKTLTMALLILPLADFSSGCGKDKGKDKNSVFTDVGYKTDSETSGVYYRGGHKEGEEGIKVKQWDISIQYLGTDGKIKFRTVRLLVPESAENERRPLVISVHYETPADDPAFFDFLNEGWAVLTPVSIPPEHLSDIVDDDLRFNIAVLNAVKRWDGIDSGRIAIKGASAGGYQVMMLSAMHLGINCAYNMSGISNLAYEFKYILYNNRFNKEMESSLSPEKRKDFNNYILPFVKTIYDNFMPTANSLGTKDMESKAWQDYSPVCHLDEISQPVIMSHSTADAIVPIYQVTEKNAYDAGYDLPAGYKLHLNEFMSDDMLNKPLDELLPQGSVETYRLNPYEDNYTGKLRFSPDKRVNINIIDEGKIEKGNNHFKDMEKGVVSEREFMKYYLSQKASQTNELSLPKLRTIAERYLGSSRLFEKENGYKEKCSGNVFGSLCSDRLDVLIELTVYLGLDLGTARDGGAAISGVSEANVEHLVDIYARLEDGYRFLDGDTAAGRDGFADNPLKRILTLLRFYANECSEERIYKAADALISVL